MNTEKLFEPSFFKKVVQQALNGLYIFDIQLGTVVFINDQYELLTGYSLEDLKSFSKDEFEQLWHPDDRKKIMDHVELLATGKEEGPIELEYRFKSKAGEWLWLLSKNIIFEKDSKGNATSIFGTFFDITERKNLEAQLRDHKIALDEANNVAETDLNGKITYVNERFCETTQYTREEVIGKNHSFLKSPFHPREFYEELWSTIIQGKVWNGRVCNKRKDGSLYWVDTTIVPFKDSNGKPYKYVAVRHDITREVELQEQLRAQIKITESALRTSHEKGKLVSELSHEIRNGLNSILGYSELLNESDISDDEKKQFIASISRSAKNLVQLMTDVLEATRLEAEKISIENTSFNLKQKIEEVIDAVRPAMEAKGLRIYSKYDNQLPEAVVGDSFRIAQVLLNLLNNAAKFTSKGEVSVVVSQLKDDFIRFMVKDTGRGISKEKRNCLFSEFEQCTSEDAKTGSGLGLSISQKLVRLMHGRIYVESELGKGSTFTFDIPLPSAQTLSLQMNH